MNVYFMHLQKVNNARKITKLERFIYPSYLETTANEIMIFVAAITLHGLGLFLEKKCPNAPSSYVGNQSLQTIKKKDF